MVILDGALRVAARNWTLYCFEGIGIALFMIATCGVYVSFLFPGSFMTHYVTDPFTRRLMMAFVAGCVALILIHSPLGKRSGGHFNPAITLAYLVLGKIKGWDASFYIASHFLGGLLGVALASVLLGDKLAHPRILYAVTQPGSYGTAPAFCAELGCAMLLMMVVLYSSNRPVMARYTVYFVGVTIALSAFFLRPISGFSLNPARTAASATSGHIWTAVWIYFTAPVIGTTCASLLYRLIFGPGSIMCAKLDPANCLRCPFICTYPSHDHTHSAD